VRTQGAKYKNYVAKVFEEPYLFFTKGKMVGGWAIPDINVKALLYHLNIGVGTAYTVRFGIQYELKENSKQKVEVILKEESEGKVRICLFQGDRSFESVPYVAEKIVGADPTPLLLDAVQAGLMLPLSLADEIRDKIKNWSEGKR
jgi:hypothetical protein